MSDNSFSEAVKFTAPNSGDTAAPEVVNNAAPGEQEPPEPKTFTQEELDAIIGKEKAKVRRQVERELREAGQPNRSTQIEAPKREKFNSDQEYLDAYVDFRAEQKIAERDQRQQSVKLDSTYAEREEAARDKYDDFQDVVYNPNLRITDAMAEAIKMSDIGPEVAYHLGSNPKEASRIAQLSPLAQAREIGKIEAALAAKKASSAPEPLNPVGARATNSKVDVTDPRSDKMSASEWIEARNKKLAQQK